MTEDMNFITYNLSEKVMVDSDGSVYPIITMFDDEGDETEDIEECVLFVAGTGGYHVTVEVLDEDFRHTKS